MKHARDRRSMPAGFKVDLSKEVPKPTTLKRKGSLSKAKPVPRSASKESIPKTLVSASETAPKIMNQTMANKVHDQEAAKARLEERRKVAREERARVEEEERKIEEVRRMEEERQRKAAEEAKERLRAEKEQRRKNLEEEERKEEERRRVEEESRLSKEKEEAEEREEKLREDQQRAAVEAETRRVRDEERLTKEEDERRERQKKLDAILRRTSGKVAVNTAPTAKREISANASAILAKHNIQIPLLAPEAKEADKPAEVIESNEVVELGSDGQEVETLEKVNDTMKEDVADESAEEIINGIEEEFEKEVNGVEKEVAQVEEVCDMLIDIELDKSEEDTSFPAPAINSELSQAL